jgi:hypothetical protein
MMHTAPTTDAFADAEASAVGSSSFMDTPNERAYGTFEVSVIDVDSESEQQPHQSSKSTAFSTQDEDEAHHTCAGDCCAIVSFLWMPFRLDTYKIVIFHFVNALFAMGAATWIILLYAITFALSPIASFSQPLRNADVATLRVLLHADTVLFNVVCPRAERIRVCSPSMGAQDGYSAQIYFAVGKLVCSAIPGAVASLTFLWTIRNFVVVLTAGTTGSTPDDPLAPLENDVLILLALAAIYASAALTKLFAIISRHVTIFFCAEYLLYAAPL